MRRRFAIPTLLALFVLLAAAAQAELSQKGNLRISFNGGFSPRSLPRDRPAPVTVTVEGAIATTDGSHPPALKRFEVAINRHGRISTQGLPECSAALLQSTSDEMARARCRAALVGHGSFTAVLESTSGPIPAGGPVLAFNGRVGGRPALLLHFSTDVPVPATLVLALKISHRAKGQFGTVLSTVVPNLAGGVGSITSIDLQLGREYTYRGRRLGFLSASCAAPAGFPGAVFTFARGSFYFADGRRLDAVLSRNCRVR